jgi:hypothetical protein
MIRKDEGPAARRNVRDEDVVDDQPSRRTARAQVHGGSEPHPQKEGQDSFQHDVNREDTNHGRYETTPFRLYDTIRAS